MKSKLFIVDYCPFRLVNKIHYGCHFLRIQPLEICYLAAM